MKVKDLIKILDESGILYCTEYEDYEINFEVNNKNLYTFALNKKDKEVLININQKAWEEN